MCYSPESLSGGSYLTVSFYVNQSQTLPVDHCWYGGTGFMVGEEVGFSSNSVMAVAIGFKIYDAQLCTHSLLQWHNGAALLESRWACCTRDSTSTSPLVTTKRFEECPYFASVMLFFIINFIPTLHWVMGSVQIRAYHVSVLLSINTPDTSVLTKYPSFFCGFNDYAILIYCCFLVSCLLTSSLNRRTKQMSSEQHHFWGRGVKSIVLVEILRRVSSNSGDSASIPECCFSLEAWLCASCLLH